METRGRVYGLYPPAPPSKAGVHTPYARHDGARSRPSSVTALDFHPPVPCCESPTPGRHAVKTAAAPVASSDPAAAAIASGAAVVTMVAARTLAVTPATVTATVATATAAAASTLAVVAETCRILPRLPGGLTPRASATVAGGSPFPMTQVTLPEALAPPVAATAAGGFVPPHAAGKRPTDVSLGCSQVTSRVYYLRPDGSRILQQSA